MEQLTVSTPFTEALNSYIKDIQGAIDRDFKSNYPRLYNTALHPEIITEPFKKMIRIIRQEKEIRLGWKSALCFIDENTGDIHPPLGYERSSKKVVGNIYSERRPVTSGELYR